MRGSERVVIKKETNKINVEGSEIVGEKQIEAGENDKKYVEAIEFKGEVAILRAENQLMNIIKLESLQTILRLMNRTLKDFYYDISFGIYSSEEITEFRKSISSKIENKVDEYVKDYDYIIPPDEKLQLPSFFGDDIFESVQKEIEEKERIKKEEELRKLKELEEKKKKEEEEERKRKEAEEEEKKRKEAEEERKRKAAEKEIKERENLIQNLSENNTKKEEEKPKQSENEREYDILNSLILLYIIFLILNL
jgi:hypothetical protein